VSAVKPLSYAARCVRRGWHYDPQQMSIGHLTPAQRRRALRKERRSWRQMADAGVYEWQTDINEEGL
jgi:hypothetical protein